MKKVAISIGDLNGIGIQLALENHNTISKKVIPKSGAYAYASFIKAVELARNKEVDAICTLPIHKKAWELTGVKYKGHTDALRDFFDAEAIMMLGCSKMYVAFLIDFYHTAKPSKKVGVLGLNPHAGDDGVLGSEETIIQKAIDNANVSLRQAQGTVAEPVEARLLSPVEAFSAPLVPDVAFTPRVRANFTHYIAMYHDQGLAPLKALYFDEGINVSLNLPILRTSVDHGTAFDVAYKNIKLNSLSYINAVKYIVNN